MPRSIRGARPEVASGLGPIAVLDGATRSEAHIVPKIWIIRDSADVLGEVIRLKRARHVPSDAVLDEIARPALIRHHARYSRGKSFKDDIAERIGCARKTKTSAEAKACASSSPAR